MTQAYFVNAHSPEWFEATLAMTKDYFAWMNDQMQATCNLSIEGITGMSIDAYIATAMNVISPKGLANAALFLLVTSGDAVAMGGIRQLPNGNGEVVRIYTKPEYRGYGYGGLVLDKLIFEAKNRGFQILNLDTGIFMNAAQSMYISHGFRKCEPYEGAEPPPRLLSYWLYFELDLASVTIPQCLTLGSMQNNAY